MGTRPMSNSKKNRPGNTQKAGEQNEEFIEASLRKVKNWTQGV